MNKKVVTFTVAMVLLLGVTLGATLALLTRETDQITNTFVAGGIGDLTLTEHEVNADGFTIGANEINTGNQQYTVIPGTDIEKDPTVTFTAADSDLPVYVFVELDVLNWTKTDETCMGFTAQANNVDALGFAINETWTHLAGAGDDTTKFVYYMELDKGADIDADTGLIIKNATITVSDKITETDIQNLAATSLGFKAYAIQSDSFDDPTAAWTSVSTQANS